MPHRRPVRKGSFGGRLDELVEQFPDKGLENSRPKRPAPRRAAKDERHINHRLFGDAWRKGGKGRGPERP